MSFLMRINYGLTRQLRNTITKQPIYVVSQCRTLYIHSQLCYPVQPIKMQTQSKTTSKLHQIKDSLAWKLFGKSKLLRSSFVLYARCTDDVNALEFFEVFKMPDTFFSWFLITELHIWMCQVRLTKEGERGRFMRNKMVDALWKDVDVRTRKLGEVDATTKKEGLNDLLEHYQAALFSYDEGLLSNDTVLAGALWRNFFSYDCESAICLEKLVHYVRLNITHLEGIPTEDLYNGEITWLPLTQVSKNK